MKREDILKLRSGNFQRIYPVTTRWTDNDMYGHLNNSVYFQFFDSAINRFLIEEADTVTTNSSIRNVVAESGCTFIAEGKYPTDFQVGLRVEKLGRTSVIYRVALFSEASSINEALHAAGHWVQVFVESSTSRPTAIPPTTRNALEKLQTPEKA